MAGGAARGFLAAFAAIAAGPGAILLTLLAAGGLAPAAGWVALALVVLWGAGLAFLWQRDLQRLAAALGAARPGRREPVAEPLLAPLAAIGAAAAGLGRVQAAEAAALARRAALDAEILARLPDPLILLGGEGAVLRANAAAAGFFGADLPAVLRHPTLRAAIERALAAAKAESVEIGVPIPLAREMRATVLPLSVPGPERAVVVIADRTRERAVERMRADFVANVSHELRNPLASLIGFVETLRGPAADDRAAQTRFLAIMAEQGARMSRLIDDLLALSRIEIDEHQAPGERIDLADLLARAANGFEPRLGSGRRRLVIGIEPGLPEIGGDPDQLIQVLQNLLENALKYGGEAGEIRLTAHPVAAGTLPWPGRAGAVFAVADRGPGIPPEHLPRLTERFYRVDTGRSRAMGGTGLGLAIVKHIVNRHRGQLLIESAEGQGTTVSVWLPAAGSAG